MLWRIDELLQPYSETQRQEFWQAASVACQLAHRYPTALANGDMRQRMLEIDNDLWAILQMIYTHHAFTWHELMLWVDTYASREGGVRVMADLPDHLVSVLEDDVRVMPAWSVGVTAQGNGKLYKRTLERDVQMLLKK